MIMLANAGVPMLAIEWPAMLLVLLPVIAVEALVIRQRVKLPYRQATRVSAAANAASTLVGLPIAWVGMIALNLLSTGGRALGLESDAQKIAAVTLQAAWLVPYEEDLYWMVPAAMLVLLIPNYIVSVWLEVWVGRRLLPQEDRRGFGKTMIVANAASYSGLFVICAGWLVYALRTDQ